MEEKKTVRDRMKKMRRNLSADTVARFGGKICGRLLTLSEIQSAGEILLYSAVRGEADLNALVKPLRERGKTIAFPRVRGDEIDFREVSDLSELIPGAFGIPEPAAEAKLLLPSPEAVILVPGVAFTEDGNRIGMGRGYYDRYLSKFPDILRVGIAYEAQLGAVWIPDENDLPMDRIVTEDRVIFCVHL